MAWVVIAALLIGGPACSKEREPYRVSLHATRQLNPDDNGAPLPVLVRIYQLKSKDKFEQASFKSLWKADKDLLEGDVLDRKEFTVHPESDVILNLDVETKKGAEFLGVMALFREPDADTWKRVIRVKVRHWNPFSTPTVHLLLDKHSLTTRDKE